MVNLGQILREGDAVTSLQTMDPIYVNFSLPQQRLSQLVAGTAVRLKTDAAPTAVFDGKINAISPEIDSVTRNIRVQATIANTDEKLRPGMYASVEVVLPTETDALTIPATAVLYAPYGDSVFVIDEKKDEKSGKVQQVLRQQFVRLGGARGDFVNVVDGLKPGENVVTSGVFKLRPGMNVVIDNTLAPDAKLAPKPKNA
jgi:membrane fusion protein (multidrug efflux system)